MGAVLGVATLRYAPFAVFCFASPALSVLYGITAFRIEHVAVSDPLAMSDGAAETEGASP